MRFALEHQIKSTSGIGVNGGRAASACSLSECLEAWGSKGFPCIQPLSQGMTTSKPMGLDPPKERWERGALNDFSSKWAITPVLQMGKSKHRNVKRSA